MLEDAPPTTFRCHMGKFDSRVPQQGDCNAPVSMMGAMNYPVRNFYDIIICLGHILIANHTYEEHLNTIRKVLEVAEGNKLWFNNKCQVMPGGVNILGNILTHQGLETDSDKVDDYI